MLKKEKAISKNISLYPWQIKLLKEYSKRNKVTESRAIQYALEKLFESEDWKN